MRTLAVVGTGYDVTCMEIDEAKVKRMKKGNLLYPTLKGQ
jgi:UDP-glucose 6-dehydrogenase